MLPRVADLDLTFAAAVEKGCAKILDRCLTLFNVVVVKVHSSDSEA